MCCVVFVVTCGGVDAWWWWWWWCKEIEQIQASGCQGGCRVNVTCVSCLFKLSHCRTVRCAALSCCTCPLLSPVLPIPCPSPPLSPPLLSSLPPPYRHAPRHDASPGVPAPTRHAPLWWPTTSWHGAEPLRAWTRRRHVPTTHGTTTHAGALVASSVHPSRSVWPCLDTLLALNIAVATPVSKSPLHQHTHIAAAAACNPQPTINNHTQAAAAAAPKSDWTEHTAPDGKRKYYFNSKTQQSTWTKPEELMTLEVRACVWLLQGSVALK